MAFALIALFSVLHYIKILAPLENLVITIVSPAQKIFYPAGVFFNNLNFVQRYKIGITGKNELLKEENQRLLIENLKLKNELEQLQNIAAQAQYLTEKKFQHVISRITGRDTFEGYTLFVLDKGAKDGIIIGLPVIVRNGIFIGKIVEVHENSSKVLLLTSSSSHTAATIENKNKTLGVVSGEFGLSMKMELIPKEEKITINNLALTSGLEEFIPAGLIIGEIIRIAKDPNGFFQTAYLRPAFPYNNIILVSILKSHEF